ncbi:hypothetical protein P168DRAFT_1354 [Aspergillus campestris IBT 28561]|uniref:Uncharacterized protein n=1 Tax=Aspergillus campestris (strain IBT 28561) TaxID=1392248 RepID=A0A2I1DCZ7_ASPC2|nr:uncharacterized protein P168DRAFT_1354 [Aspergillus campestris IBT 28561]PKY07741.1 hypothetical protein P168DRAFT_1354 [Aspergillus campestris IBT 28561]
MVRYPVSLLFQIGHSPPDLVWDFGQTETGCLAATADESDPSHAVCFVVGDESEAEEGYLSCFTDRTTTLGGSGNRLVLFFSLLSFLVFLFLIFGHGAVTLPSSPWRTRLQSPSLKGSCMRWCWGQIQGR